MSHDPVSAASPSASGTSDSVAQPTRPGQQRAPGDKAPRKRWLVQFDGHEQHVEADELEITAAGVLVFYRSASWTDQERTVLTAFSPALPWRCQLESER